MPMLRKNGLENPTSSMPVIDSWFGKTRVAVIAAISKPFSKYGIIPVTQWTGSFFTMLRRQVVHQLREHQPSPSLTSQGFSLTSQGGPSVGCFASAGRARKLCCCRCPTQTPPQTLTSEWGHWGELIKRIREISKGRRIQVIYQD